MLRTVAAADRNPPSASPESGPPARLAVSTKKEALSLICVGNGNFDGVQQKLMRLRSASGAVEEAEPGQIEGYVLGGDASEGSQPFLDSAVNHASVVQFANALRCRT